MIWQVLSLLIDTRMFLGQEGALHQLSKLLQVFCMVPFITPANMSYSHWDQTIYLG